MVCRGFGKDCETLGDNVQPFDEDEGRASFLLVVDGYERQVAYAQVTEMYTAGVFRICVKS